MNLEVGQIWVDPVDNESVIIINRVTEYNVCYIIVRSSVDPGRREITDTIPTITTHIEGFKKIWSVLDETYKVKQILSHYDGI